MRFGKIYPMLFAFGNNFEKNKEKKIRMKLLFSFPT